MTDGDNKDGNLDPETLFDRVNDLAEGLQMPRSRLLVLAVEAFIRQHENREMLDALDEVYGTPDAGEQALRDGMRRKQRRLVDGEW